MDLGINEAFLRNEENSKKMNTCKVVNLSTDDEQAFFDEDFGLYEDCGLCDDCGICQDPLEELGSNAHDI